MNNKIVKILLPLIIIALIGFLLVIPYLDNSEIEQTASLLKSNQNTNSISTKLASKEFINLPKNVKGYIKKAIKNKSLSPAISHISLIGKTRTSPQTEWLEIKSKIHYSITTPNYIEINEVLKYSFLWDRTINQYINRKASTVTKFISSIKVNDFVGNKLNRSFLIKYLMLAFASPTALLPSNNVHWKKNNNLSARAIIWDEQKKGSADFYFNDQNEVTKIVSYNRYMPGKIDYTKEQFTIHLANYKDVGNYYIPTYFEFQWNLSGGDYTFSRFQITDIIYE